MASPDLVGWKALTAGYPWFKGPGLFPLPAYSEFMPPPRLGRSPYGGIDPSLFDEDDPFGWRVSEAEEEWELKPGFDHLAARIIPALVRLAKGEPEPQMSGHQGLNLVDNPYWSPELAESSVRPGGEHFIVLLPVALSRTQDDKGHVRWTVFGSSEQGPERAFWRSFCVDPDHEAPEDRALDFLARLLAAAFGVQAAGRAGLRAAGFRILPANTEPRFPYWSSDPLPAWAKPFLIDDSASFDDTRYLLTFRPFTRFPAAARARYLSGRLALLPWPGSLVFWGQQKYIKLQRTLKQAMQIPLLKLVPRREGPGGLRVPQTGWLHEAGTGNIAADIHKDLLVGTYKRTSRWDRIERHAQDALAEARESKVTRTFFGTSSEDLGLYGKPMARNGQIWTSDSRLLLNGPLATAAQIAAAEKEIERGGLFRYRFQFPAMRVGRYEVYWHRPLAAYWNAERSLAEIIPDAPTGFLTADDAAAPDPAKAAFLWPRLLRRAPYLAALDQFEHLREHYTHQTAFDVLALLAASASGAGKPLPRDFARALLRLAEDKRLEDWLAELPARAAERAEGERLKNELEGLLEPTAKPGTGAARPASDSPEPAASPESVPESLTFDVTTTREFEEGWWKDVAELSAGAYARSENADGVGEEAGPSRPGLHRRDLQALGDHLLKRHRGAITGAGGGIGAVCGEIPFRWTTDFDFSLFGGWRDNQEGRVCERDILLIIPGRNRAEAVILADHYDTAYEEDRFYPDEGGNGARISAAGADDNHSATAALLQAAPVFLRLAREGRLERDVWLLHLTGEEFPADSLGARHFVEALIEGTLRPRTGPDDEKGIDLSNVLVRGVFVMDMIAHNRSEPHYVFQISPGRTAASLRLSKLAQGACRDWNLGAVAWNRRADRRGRGRGERSADGVRTPAISLHPHLKGEVRTADDPRSTLFNTDGQIFSDAGVPVVLFMEDYDINRHGYHDSLDTMANIDLDFGAALAAVAIETAARAAAAPVLD
jgi:hypothetical protein